MKLEQTTHALAALILTIGMGMGASAMAASAPESAKQCFNCHGEQGISTDEDIPRIAGASTFFLENQLFIYRESARPCAKQEFSEGEHAEEAPPADDHCALAKQLSEEEITQVAEYFSSQPFKPADQPVDQALAEQGAAVHQRSCAKCHTEGGSLALDDAGILAGQWKPYLLEQLKHYKAGERYQPEKMKPKMEELSEQDIKALVEYYAAQGKERF